MRLAPAIDLMKLFCCKQTHPFVLDIFFTTLTILVMIVKRSTLHEIEYIMPKMFYEFKTPGSISKTFFGVN